MSRPGAEEHSKSGRCEATLTIDVALEIPQLNLTHGDPGDHFLVATAKVFGLTLATTDEHIIRCADVPIMTDR